MPKTTTKITPARIFVLIIFSFFFSRLYLLFKPQVAVPDRLL